MPRLIKYVCDNCGKGEENESELRNYYQLNLTITGGNCNFYNKPKGLIVCPECAKKLGIVDENEKQLIHNITPEQQLCELIAEIARNSVSG